MPTYILTPDYDNSVIVVVAVVVVYLVDVIQSVYILSVTRSRSLKQ